MTRTANVAGVVKKRLRNALAMIGFRQRSPEILTKVYGNDDYGWLGLNVTSRQRITELNLVVGVRDEPLEAFISELMGARVFGKFAPTISVHIGYLMPERAYRPWFFDAEPSDNEIDAVARAVSEFAIPFMQDNASLTAICERLHDPMFTHRDQAIYRLPACHFLLGNLRCAATVTAENLEKLGDSKSVVAEQYRVFSAALGQLLSFGDA